MTRNREPRIFQCPLCGSLNPFYTLDINVCISCCEEFDFADVTFDDGIDDVY